ncbi:hypothetical protein CC85DRAFT_299398 [Cutaneotrichosporon oleaginosum]|uniref:Protein YOP1 n=1 Tax=Cutaneotrichosporon oleaginosum TaxID=879819 RepID=A0A0J0XXF8_9TREE|nr:uncharacterized protein CC85DRAFT_299398 [Cutaneotrichosporon oleaginosum]KLT45750.1 hypothetical protein CC85DRAFT_299398 [Cutaneotrichosporon oleaginosum]TXT04483.1 hypothetical protein COLE_07302 [Cutaneotrichosporon oleaginosum]
MSTPGSTSPQSPLQRARAAGAVHAARATDALTAARTKFDQAAAHPHAQRAYAIADEQVRALRRALGGSESVVAAEKATGIDRVRLVAGALAAFILLVPLNTFGMAQATTSALTLILPAYKALLILERGGPTENLLAYFVVLGYFQVLESLLLPILVSQIPRYYTVKLAFMIYLAHPRTNGAIKVYNILFSRKIKTPPMSPSPLSPMSPTWPGSPNGLDDRGPLSPVSPTRAAGVPLPQSPSPQDDVFSASGFTRIPRAVKE